jgi:hypothetical protein
MSDGANSLKKPTVLEKSTRDYWVMVFLKKVVGILIPVDKQL